MKKIFAIAWKDAIIRFASSSELIFFIILPVIFTLLLAGGSPSGAPTNNRVRVVVVDQANTAISQEIITELENSTAAYPELMTLADAEDEFSARRVSAVLVIPAGLDLTAIQNGTAELDFRQQPNDMDASIAQRAILTSIRRVSSAVNAANTAVDQAKAHGTFESAEAEKAYFEDALKLAKDFQSDAPERVTVIEGTTPDQVEYDPRANTSA
ncbi:MAG TPA: ABC transporter permease, partial [Anaerolineales bacterium]|nr:ABC transporter permease [Anaerolineales bacterium]